MGVIIDSTEKIIDVESKQISKNIITDFITNTKDAESYKDYLKEGAKAVFATVFDKILERKKTTLSAVLDDYFKKIDAGDVPDTWLTVGGGSGNFAEAYFDSLDYSDKPGCDGRTILDVISTLNSFRELVQCTIIPQINGKITDDDREAVGKAF